MASTIARIGAIVLGCDYACAYTQLSTINFDDREINGTGVLAFDTARHILYGNMGWPEWNGETNLFWQWHDGEFSSVGGGLGLCDPRGLEMHEGDLFLSGLFNYWTAGYDIDHLARWDGTTWGASGEPNSISYVFRSENDLWVNGDFDSIGGQPFSTYIARLVNGQWEPFGTPTPLGNGFRAAAYFQGDYYFGGNFFNPWIAEDIVRWDGTDWLSVAGGIAGAAEGWVHALEVFHDKLYVAGYFWDPGNITRNIKAWNGTSWEGFFPDLVTSVSGQVHDMEVIDGKLYLTGRWQFTGDDRQFVVLIYDGEQLCGLGEAPVGAQAYHITGNADSIFFGTTEYILSGDTVNYYAVWPVANGPDTCVTIPTGMREAARDERLHVYPNPAVDELTIDWSGSKQRPAEVRVFDMLGRCVLDERRTTWRNGKLTLDVGKLLPGMYNGWINGSGNGRFSFTKR